MSISPPVSECELTDHEDGMHPVLHIPTEERKPRVERSRSRNLSKEKKIKERKPKIPRQETDIEESKEPVRGKVVPKESKRERVYRPERGSVQKVNTNELVLLNIAFPISLADEPFTQKKYKTIIEYKYEGKKYRKHISFGKKGVPDYIDTKNVITKQSVLKDLKAYFSPLQANFYRVHLLNEYETLMESYIALRKAYNLII